ncbi:DUF4405 domain-containing protein [Methylomonas albis]|uniref:DUF4405 domain-containing protein n=1 Tax=Methylomonas albis TaxID=1854563 RepID=A0ABR9D250_9GAMM|nr:DUF4405 domain-containing protein [Methylomonas albis]MBD9355987.1 DUF4405 domain-containing protein [Methylomonas albis]
MVDPARLLVFPANLNCWVNRVGLLSLLRRINMNRTIVNIIIDLVAALLFLGMIATGYLLRYPLPPGSNKSHSLWGLTRHQWGDIHFWISLGLLAVLVIHLALHWNWIVTVIGKRCHLVKTAQPSLVRSAVWTFAVFIALCGGFVWVANRDVKEMPQAVCSAITTGNQSDTQRNKLVSEQAQASQGSQLVWQDVYPILMENCLACHGPEHQFAGFRVDRVDDFFKNEGNGPLILAGQGSQSPLIAIISGVRTNMPMADRHKLAESEVFRIKAWIDQGAK